MQRSQQCQLEERELEEQRNQQRELEKQQELELQRSQQRELEERQNQERALDEQRELELLRSQQRQIEEQQIQQCANNGARPRQAPQRRQQQQQQPLQQPVREPGSMRPLESRPASDLYSRQVLMCLDCQPSIDKWIDDLPSQESQNTNNTDLFRSW